MHIDFSTSDAAMLCCLQETQEERSLRTRVFVQGAFRWYVSIVGFIVFFVIGCIAIPHIFSPVKVRPSTTFRAACHLCSHHAFSLMLVMLATRAQSCSLVSRAAQSGVLVRDRAVQSSAMSQ